jgi:crotonobetainyl-CoA:carnitine CoA-transferase CaiB-like acyl-CoA transferase
MAKTSTRPMVRIHNAETNEVIDREMNDVEFEAHQAQQEANKIADAAKAKAEADKAALLARLGLTEDELKTILG